MKSLFLPIFLPMLLLGQWSAAQPYTIKGTVVDKEIGEPLVGALVRVVQMCDRGDTIVPVRLRSSTGINGKYMIRDIPMRTCTIEASSIGYQTSRRVVEANPEGAVETCFQLTAELFPGPVPDWDFLHPLVDKRATNWTRRIDGESMRHSASRQ